MLIGIDASRANEEKRTGVGWYTYHTIQEFKKITSDNVRVILYSREPLQGELAELPGNWDSKVLKWFPGKYGRLWTQIRLSWEMLFHAPDVLFIPAHVFPVIHPKKTVMTVHDIAAVKFPESYNWFEKWYSLWSAKIALKKLWRVIVPSQFTANELIDLQVNRFASKKIKVVYHGYDKKYSRNIKGIDEVLTKYSITKPYLLSIGRLEEKKNTVRIIKAFEVLKHNTYDLRLVLVGGPGYGYEKVKEVIDNSEFKNDIITLGWVSDKDLPALMQSAEVFVFPSLYEGFGIPVLEAFAAGTPVVTSNSTSLPEVGGDACEYVDLMDINDIARGVENILKNEDLKLKNIEKGEELVKKFSWEKSTRKTWEVLISD